MARTLCRKLLKSWNPISDYQVDLVAKGLTISRGYQPERLDRMDVAERPYALLAELSYLCPLHRPYCSNPVRSAEKDELNPEQWE
jgi:hypothetical protein